MITWRLLPYHVGSSERHFALGTALVLHSPRPTIWWHSTERPTLILGPGQAKFDLTACREAGVLVVRRQAGGAAVLAGPGVLGLDVFLPRDDRLALADVVETYRWLGEVWVHALRTLGIDSRLVAIAEARAAVEKQEDEVVRMACFGGLSPYEVVVGSRKLVGLAQVRRASGILLQAGIHRSFNPDRLAELLSPSDSSRVAMRLREVAVGLDGVGGRANNEHDVMRAFHRSLEECVGVRLEPGTWTERELEHVRNLDPGARVDPVPA